MILCVGLRQPGWTRRQVRLRRRAFSLVELIVVTAVLLLLAMMMGPYVHGVFETAHDATCKHNLGQITTALHTGARSGLLSDSRGVQIPTGSSWPSTVLATTSGSKDILFCREDNTEEQPKGVLAIETVLKDMYILQYHTGSQTHYDCSFLQDILAGKQVSDPQVWAIYPAGGRWDEPKGEHWPPELIPRVKDNQIFIGIDNDAAVMITFDSSEIVVEPRDSTSHQYSRHWVMKGAGTPVNPLPGGQEPEDEDDEVLCRLWGWHVSELDPPYKLEGGFRTSYGINRLLEPSRWEQKQIYVMDANTTTVDPYSQGVDRVEDRHFKRSRYGVLQGRANVATVDGSVRGWTKDQLEREFEIEGPNAWER